MSLSIYLMSRFNPYTDFETILWPRLLSGAAVAFHFVPLTTLTMRFVPKEELGTATALFSLMQSMGGSVGIAAATTMYSRSIQIHSVYLSRHVTVYDRVYQWWAAGSASVAHMKEHGQYLLYRLLNREASMLAFRDVFLDLAILGVAVLPLIFSMRRVKLGQTGPAAGA